VAAATPQQRLILVLVALAAIMTLAVWYLKPIGPSPDERRVREAIRNARSLYLTTVANTKTFPNERLFLDAELLAEKFQLKGRRDRKDVAAGVMVYLTESPGTTDEIVLLHPPDSVFVDKTLYAVEPGFWTELLSQVPKTKKWLKQVAPHVFENPAPVENR
jgi:hypothetical protein